MKKPFLWCLSVFRMILFYASIICKSFQMQMNDDNHYSFSRVWFSISIPTFKRRNRTKKKKTFYNIKENTDLCHFMLDKVIKIDNYSKSLNMQFFLLKVQHCRNNMLQSIVPLLIRWETSLHNGGVAFMATNIVRLLYFRIKIQEGANVKYPRLN